MESDRPYADAKIPMVGESLTEAQFMTECKGSIGYLNTLDIKCFNGNVGEIHC